MSCRRRRVLSNSHMRMFVVFMLGKLDRPAVDQSSHDAASVTSQAAGPTMLWRPTAALYYSGSLNIMNCSQNLKPTIHRTFRKSMSADGADIWLPVCKRLNVMLLEWNHESRHVTLERLDSDLVFTSGQRSGVTVKSPVNERLSTKTSTSSAESDLIPLVWWRKMTNAF